MSHTATLAALQVWGAKARIARKLLRDPVRRNEHFQKYNIGAATYDETYSRSYGLEYLTYLDKQIRAAATRKPDLLLLPEFAFTPGVIASPMPGVARNPNALADGVRLYKWSGDLFIDWLCERAKKLRIHLAAASFTVRGGKIYNTGLLADDKGQLALRYEKIHLPEDEMRTVAAGKSYGVADTRLGRVAFSICYDVQFPEHHAMLATRGAQIVLHPSAGYTLPGEKHEMGQNRLRVRASDHHAAIVYACAAPEHDWDPRESAVIAPNGDVLACVRGMRAGLAIATLTIPDKRAWPGDRPDAPDREAIRRSLRRPDTYAPLVSPMARIRTKTR